MDPNTVPYTAHFEESETSPSPPWPSPPDGREYGPIMAGPPLPSDPDESKYGSLTASPPPNDEDPRVPYTSLVASLFNNPQYSDFEIRGGTRVWHAHKLILSKRSPYFDTACNGSFVEAQQGWIALPEKESVIDAVLAFIYTDNYDVRRGPGNKHGEDQDGALAFHALLCLAADKYDLPDLLGLAFGLYSFQAYSWDSDEMVIRAIDIVYQSPVDIGSLYSDIQRLMVGEAKEELLRKNKKGQSLALAILDTLIESNRPKQYTPKDQYRWIPAFRPSPGACSPQSRGSFVSQISPLRTVLLRMILVKLLRRNSNEPSAQASRHMLCERYSKVLVLGADISTLYSMYNLEDES